MAEPRLGSLQRGPGGGTGVGHLTSLNWVSGTLHAFPLSLIHTAQGTVTVSLRGEAPEHSGGAGHSSSHGSAGCHCLEADRAGRLPLWAVLLGSLCSRGPPTSTFLSPFLRPQARDVYEEAIRTVMTVRDFTQVFDSYAQFEESMIAAKMETASELGREEEGELPGAVLGWGGEKAGLAGRALRVLSGRGKGEVCVRGQQGGRTAEWPGWVNLGESPGRGDASPAGVASGASLRSPERSVGAGGWRWLCAEALTSAPRPSSLSQMMWTWSCAWRASSSSSAGGPCCSTASCYARTRTTCTSGTSAWPCTRAAPGRCVTALPLAAPTTCQGPSCPADSIPPAQIINTYTEAVQTVDPFKATGKPHTLWVAFAKFYEDNGQLDDVSAVPFVHLCVCVRVLCVYRCVRGQRTPEAQTQSRLHEC